MVWPVKSLNPVVACPHDLDLPEIKSFVLTPRVVPQEHLHSQVWFPRYFCASHSPKCWPVRSLNLVVEWPQDFVWPYLRCCEDIFLKVPQEHLQSHIWFPKNFKTSHSPKCMPKRLYCSLDSPCSSVWCPQLVFPSCNKDLVNTVSSLPHEHLHNHLLFPA